MRNLGVTFIRFNMLIICALCLHSCSGPTAPEFVRLSDTVVELGAGNDIDIQANVVYRNPNSFGATLVGYDIAISLEDIPISKIKEEPGIPIPPMEEFSIPVRTSIKTDELKQYESRISELLRNAIFSKLKVHYKGSVTFSLSGMRLKVPVDLTDDVSLQFDLGGNQD